MNNTNNEHFELLPYQADANREGVFLSLEISIKLVSPHPAYSAASRNLNSSCRIWRCVLPRSNLLSDFSVLPFALDRPRPEIQGTSSLSTAVTSHVSLHTECRMQRDSKLAAHTAWLEKLSLSPLPPLFFFPSPSLTPIPLSLSPPQPILACFETAIIFLSSMNEK